MKGPERDIHSGNDGGVFNEPLSDLTKLLASLVDSRNNIMVPGFYAGVRPNTLGAALQRLDKCHEFSLEGYREALGIPKLASAANMRSAVTLMCGCNPVSQHISIPHGVDQRHRHRDLLLIELWCLAALLLSPYNMYWRVTVKLHKRIALVVACGLMPAS